MSLHLFIYLVNQSVGLWLDQSTSLALHSLQDGKELNVNNFSQNVYDHTCLLKKKSPRVYRNANETIYLFIHLITLQ